MFRKLLTIVFRGLLATVLNNVRRCYLCRLIYPAGLVIEFGAGLVSFLKINVFYIHSLFRNVFNIHTFNTKILNTFMKNTVSTQVLNRFFGVIQSILAYFSTFLDACFFHCSFKISIKSIFDSFRFFGSTKIFQIETGSENSKIEDRFMCNFPP